MKVSLYAATTFVALSLLMAGRASAQTSEVGTLTSLPATSSATEPARAGNVVVGVTPRQYILTTSDLHYGGQSKVVLVPSAQTDPEQLATLAEDMGIMCRLLDGKLGQANPGAEARYLLRNILRSKPADPFPDFFRSDGYATEGMYVDGYGALFLVRVSFPLTAPPEAGPETEAPEEVDQVWTETKRQMYSPNYNQKREGTAETYDALRVEELKRVLTHAMKHTVNIRGLGPEDWVTIAVRGWAPTVETAAISPRTGRYSRYDSVSSTAGGSVLTIRAKMTAVKAFFKKDLTYEQFQKQTQTLTY